MKLLKLLSNLAGLRLQKDHPGLDQSTTAGSPTARGTTTEAESASARRESRKEICLRWVVAALIVVAVPQSAAAESVTLSQSSSHQVSAGNSIACSSGPETTAETSYYRVFHLADFGITEPFLVNSVTIGIESATGGEDQSQPLTIRLYDSGNLASPGAPVAAFDTVIANQSLSTVTLPIEASIGSGDLIVEVFSPDGTSAGDSFVMGSNSAGQTAPSYIRAPFCGIATPTDLASVGAENMHIVITVTGDALPDVVGGAVTGMTPSRVVCRNVTTGQQVVILGGASSWDCEAAGLVVNQGDRVQQVIGGTAN